MTTFANRLQKLREHQGLSIQEMARRLGVSASTYREWELGAAIRGERAYPLLASLLGTNLHYLLTGEMACIQLSCGRSKVGETTCIQKKLDEIKQHIREIEEIL